MTEPVEPLTPEEQATNDQLNHQNEMFKWQEREAEREARLVTIAPIAAALGTKTGIDQTIAALEQGAPALGFDTGARALRVAGILRYDALKLIELHAQLQVPEPEPVAPEAAA